MTGKSYKPHELAWCVNRIDYERSLRWYCVTLIKALA